VRRLVSAWKPVADDPKRGLDHGAFIPLMGMYPRADIPVLQVSLPSEDPRELFDLGQALAPLRDQGVLIVGSGFLVHNLRLAQRYFNQPDLPAPAWAKEFDAWSAEVLAKKDFDALLDYRRLAPGVDLALPTQEHFVPVITALGAAAESGPVTFPITGYLGNLFTKRSVQFG
jgi:4,5-DOPA dioxygenase extradiol